MPRACRVDWLLKSSFAQRTQSHLDFWLSPMTSGDAEPKLYRGICMYNFINEFICGRMRRQKERFAIRSGLRILFATRLAFWNKNIFDDEQWITRAAPTPAVEKCISFSHEMSDTLRFCQPQLRDGQSDIWLYFVLDNRHHKIDAS